MAFKNVNLVIVKVCDTYYKVREDIVIGFLDVYLKVFIMGIEE